MEVILAEVMELPGSLGRAHFCFCLRTILSQLRSNLGLILKLKLSSYSVMDTSQQPGPDERDFYLSRPGAMGLLICTPFLESVSGK